MKLHPVRQSLFAPINKDSAAHVAYVISRVDYGMGRSRAVRIAKYRRAVQVNLYMVLFQPFTGMLMKDRSQESNRPFEPRYNSSPLC
jgi:hypothetical protein